MAFRTVPWDTPKRPASSISEGIAVPGAHSRISRLVLSSALICRYKGWNDGAAAAWGIGLNIGEIEAEMTVSRGREALVLLVPDAVRAGIIGRRGSFCLSFILYLI